MSFKEAKNGSQLRELSYRAGINYEFPYLLSLWARPFVSSTTW